ncbi:MAG: methylmalonyl Co-A mutase-associated GTPase MeaB [Actinomycetota bacterium]|nr:methylmalonyl Co-A mutase-associated GTPase MeaB [Actinomycetota bacterium]
MAVRSRDPATLLEAARGGDRGAIGRLLSFVERGGDRAREVGRLTFPSSREVESVVGITGAPGSGKSSLTDRLVTEARRSGGRIGVLAIDPSSPLSGGAILGDRVRMQGHAGDEGVFVRSMASRGHLGGLALAAPEAIRVLVAVGIPRVIVETVGVGQVEVDVAGAADTTVVVVTPGWGDSVQANKAGLLEIADIFVVNKADRSGAAETRSDLEHMLDLDTNMGAWRPPVLLTSATVGDGVAELWEAIEEHGEHLGTTGELDRRRAARLEGELTAVLVRRLERDVRGVADGAAWNAVRARVVSGTTDPYEAASELLGALTAAVETETEGRSRSG